MKKKAVFALLTALLLALTACGGRNAAQEEPPAQSQAQENTPARPETRPEEQTQPEAAFAAPVWTSLSDARQICADDGTVVLELTMTIPRISNPEVSPAYAAINDLLAEHLSASMDAAQEGMSGYALDDYAWRLEEGRDSAFHAWDLQYEIRWESEQAVSLSGLGYIYTGGAHGDTWYSSLLFDLNTGAQLSFADLFDDPDTVKAETLSLLENRAMDAGSDDPAEDAFPVEPETLHDFFDPERFYLTDEGFVFYFGTYELGPYAMGIPTYTIPWDQMPAQVTLWK